MTGKCVTTRTEEWNPAIWLGQAERMKCEKRAGQAGGVACVLPSVNSIAVVLTICWRSSVCPGASLPRINAPARRVVSRADKGFARVVEARMCGLPTGRPFWSAPFYHCYACDPIAVNIVTSGFFSWTFD